MQKKFVILGCITLSLLWFVYGYSSKNFNIVNSAASYVAHPVLQLSSWVSESAKEFFKERKTIQQLRALAKQLSQEREALQQEVIALQGQLQYCTDTNELRQFAKRYDTSQLRGAQIIAKIFSDAEHYYYVDAGSNKGIEPDMVAVYKNCLLGRVTDVYPWYSKVLLITDRACKVAAFCSRTKAQGIHEGINKKDETKLSFVSRLEALLDGDMVISSGEGLVFPRGFALGRINEFYVDNLYYNTSIEPLLDISTLSYCYLLKKGIMQ